MYVPSFVKVRPQHSTAQQGKHRIYPFTPLIASLIASLPPPPLPITPSPPQNYYLPIFEVPVTPLLVASCISSAFYCGAFCYVGSTIDTLANAVEGKASGQGGAVQLAVLVGSIVMTFLLLIGIGIKVRWYIQDQEQIQKEQI